MATNEEVMDALRDVIDPELGLDFVELGLIYNVAIDDGAVSVTYTLTTPGCPIGPQVSEQIEEFVSDLDGVNAVRVDAHIRTGLVAGTDERRRQVRARLAGRARAAQFAIEVDRAHVVLRRQLVEHGLDDIEDVSLVVAEIVAQRLQRRVDDLQLGCGEVQVEGDLAGLDQIQILFVGHRQNPTACGAVNVSVVGPVRAWRACRPPGRASGCGPRARSEPSRSRSRRPAGAGPAPDVGRPSEPRRLAIGAARLGRRRGGLRVAR